ncbi:MAG: beta-ketoacyl synthase N-terminal-like domain-containing protein, partial [Desulfobacula sp.]
MTEPVYITGAGAITSLGPDLDALFDALLANRTGICNLARFDTRSYSSVYAGVINALDEKKRLPLIYQLADLLIHQIGPVNADTILIVASTKAGIDRLTQDVISPENIPAGLLLSDLTGYISKKIGLEQEGININSACASSTIAIAKGATLIESGCADAILVCCLDTVSQFVFSGFSALGAMSDTPARPFDRNRNGLTLGEGAAAIMLMNEKRALALGRPKLARISGWGISGDAVHLTAPAKNGSGLIQAINSACKKAGIRT